MSKFKSVVGVFVISTNKYSIFIQPLVDTINRYFLEDHKIIIHLFTDIKRFIVTTERVEIKQYIIEPYKFPFATLYRYKIFSEKAELTNEEYVFYIDVDMKICAPINNEILNEITVVRHPGFFISNGWGSPNVDQRSTAYIEPEKRKEYVCGGFNGGSRREFMKICSILSHKISIDEENGVMAEYHDESHLNALISKMPDRSKVTILDSSYCQPEQEHLQKAWGIDHLPKRIIALSKDHKTIR